MPPMSALPKIYCGLAAHRRRESPRPSPAHPGRPRRRQTPRRSRPARAPMLTAAFAPLDQRLDARPFRLRILAARHNYQESVAHRRLILVALALDGTPSP